MEQSMMQERQSHRARDMRLPVLGGVLLLVLALGFFFSLSGNRAIEIEPPAAHQDQAAKPSLAELQISPGDALREQAESFPVEYVEGKPSDAGRELNELFKRANGEIKAKRYDLAIAMINAEQQRLKDVPEAYLLLGRALEGKKDYAAARDFYKAALDRNPYMFDAYWGFATASEGLGDLESALGGMRNYLHTEPDLDPKRLKVSQARSAIWEWESQLERGPWGPTKGIPPGFTAEEIKRDGRGVGAKMQVTGTEKPDGTTQAEMKHAKKYQVFPKP